MKVFIILGIFILFMLYVFLDMQRISVKRYCIIGKDNLKIIQLSDLHKKTFGKNNKKIVDMVKRESPDVIVFTGDLVSRNQTDFSKIQCLLQDLSKITTVYYVWGNHEVDMSPNSLKRLTHNFKNSGATLLNNQNVNIGEHTKLWGLTLPLKCYRNGDSYNNLYYYTQVDVQSSLGRLNLNDFNILMAHSPFFFSSYASWGADLSLCGHVHGGIIRLPFINGLLSPERKLFPKYSGGLYLIDNKKMIVSRGLGKLRIFNPPEVSIVEISKSKG